MSIGPMWMSTHGCSVHSEAGLNFSSSPDSGREGDGGKREEERHPEREQAPHDAFASAPKKVTSETASSSV